METAALRRRVRRVWWVVRVWRWVRKGVRRAWAVWGGLVGCLFIVVVGG